MMDPFSREVALEELSSLLRTYQTLQRALEAVTEEKQEFHERLAELMRDIEHASRAQRTIRRVKARIRKRIKRRLRRLARLAELSRRRGAANMRMAIANEQAPAGA